MSESRVLYIQVLVLARSLARSFVVVGTSVLRPNAGGLSYMYLIGCRLTVSKLCLCPHNVSFSLPSSPDSVPEGIMF